MTGASVLAVMEGGSYSASGSAPGSTPNLNASNGKISNTITVPNLQASTSTAGLAETSWSPGVNSYKHYSMKMYSGNESAQMSLYLSTPLAGNPLYGLKTAIVASSWGGWSRSALHFCLASGTNMGSNYQTGTQDSRVSMWPSGKLAVGLGTTEPGAGTSLQIASNGVAGGSWTSSSDARLKENVQDVSVDVCEKVLMALSLKTYTRNDRGDGEKDKVRIGLLAQSVDAACQANGLSVTNLVMGGEVDTIVKEGPRDPNDPETPGPEVTEITAPSYLSLDYARIAALSIPVIQKQAQTIATLQEAIVQLISQVAALEAKV